jgi:ATP-dependent DNA ligase
MIPTSSCILDGEMLVWDPLLQKYLAFGTLKTAALGKHKVLEIKTKLSDPLLTP